MFVSFLKRQFIIIQSENKIIDEMEILLDLNLPDGGKKTAKILDKFKWIMI